MKGNKKAKYIYQIRCLIGRKLDEKCTRGKDRWKNVNKCYGCPEAVWSHNEEPYGPWPGRVGK